MKALELKNVSKSYDGKKYALKDVSLTVEQGDIYGLLGANGAGKSTLIGSITGLVNKQKGEIKIFGKDSIQFEDECKAQIGIVPQEFNFSIFEKVEDIILWQAGYFGITKKDAMPQLDYLLETLNLKDKRYVPARALSGGMKRRLMIARALIHKPKFLFLDEPTAGVDVELRGQTLDFVRSLNKEHGVTIFLTTHYLEEAENMCNKIAIIKDGKILKEDSKESLLSQLHSETFIAKTNHGITKNFGDIKFKTLDGITEITVTNQQSLTKIFEIANANNVEILDIRPKANKLESLYLELLKN